MKKNRVFGIPNDENIIFETKQSLRSIWWVFLIGIPGIFLLGIGLLVILVAWLYTINNRYAFTEKAIYWRYGILLKRTKRIEFAKITDIGLIKTLFGRLFNYGALEVNTAGTAGTEMKVFGIARPEEFQDILNNTLENEKKKKDYEERIKRLKDRYYTGELTEEQYKLAESRIKEEYSVVK